MAEEIINRVEKSGIVQFDLEDWIKDAVFESVDISQFLVEGFLLKEKDFRKEIKNHDWKQYEGKTLVLSNKDEAIITTWAIMLIASELAKVNADFFFGEQKAFFNHFVQQKIEDLDLSEFEDSRIILKGCGNYDLDDNLYAQFVQKVQPVAKVIMFGEACSSVPVYKKR